MTQTQQWYLHTYTWMGKRGFAKTLENKLSIQPELKSNSEWILLTCDEAKLDLRTLAQAWEFLVSENQ